MELVNTVALLGIAVDEPEQLQEINGTKIACSRITISTERKSGVIDYAQVYITEKTNAELLPSIKGEQVIVIGKMQTSKDFKTNRVLTFVHADYIGVTTKEAAQQNEIKLTGKMGKGITYRVRRSGKRITTLMLETDSIFRANTKCYIPCICWQAAADRVRGWTTGDTVELVGRLQSRDFVKHLEDKTAIERTSYEVSISSIKKVTER